MEVRKAALTDHRWAKERDLVDSVPAEQCTKPCSHRWDHINQTWGHTPVIPAV